MTYGYISMIKGRFNMSELLKFSYEDEGRKSSHEGMVIQSSSIFISRHKDHRDFPHMGKNVNHANKQFQFLIHQKTNIKQRH